MKHAFLIMAHGNWNQLRMLLSLLDDKRSSFYLHIDLSADDFSLQQLQGAVKQGRITFIPRRNIIWGDVSQVECEVALIAAALADGVSDYFHLLSGADLPLHCLDHIDSFFEIHQGKEFIHFSEADDNLSGETRERLALFHPFQDKFGRKFQRIRNFGLLVQRAMGIDRLRDVEIKLGKGSNWFSITRDFALDALAFWSKHSHIFESSFCADELFIQTAILNSSLSRNLFHAKADDDHAASMRLIDWKRGSPYVFRESDIHQLISSPMLFARKFDASIDSTVIEGVVKGVLSEKARWNVAL